MEHRIIRRDGEIRTMIARYAPVIDENGTVVFDSNAIALDVV
jgi:hypothetical protein